MFDVHINNSFSEKLVGQPKFYLNLYVWICLYILRSMNGLFCEHIEYVLKTYGKSWLEAQYGI